MKKRLLLMLAAVAVAVPLWATAQAPDVLKLDGKTYDLFSNPLEAFLATNAKRLPQSEVMSSALWRGYIATFAIRDKKLFVDDVRILARGETKFRSVMKELFGDAAPHPAEWFTGHLIVPTGKLVNYVHLGYGSTYSAYTIATVIKGDVREIRTMDREQFEAFRRAQFAAFKKTPEYAERAANLSKNGDPSVEPFLFESAAADYLARIFEP